MPIKQKVPVEEKVRIIRKYLSGEISLTEGAKEARVSFESIKRWVASLAILAASEVLSVAQSPTMMIFCVVF